VLVVPAGRTATGLPIGLQIAAPHYAEPELIRFGTLVEELGAARFVPPPVD
jgi:Asp-tRNA(Asn)/Glu-tRNA(Gln) amidotransferase A subunit family amidase